MANTTNFGWETPDDTDLVKDGALAMRTLGNAIDTSLVDLKGGTAGQILAKNTNTDMDFVWIANDQGDITAVTAGTGISGGGTSGAVTITNSMATAIDAKGDLIVGTGADTFSRLAVSATNGHFLKVNSATSTGLEWGAGAASPAWTTYTPTWTNATVGNGTNTGRYYDDGINVKLMVEFILGSTSSVGSFPKFSLPVNASARQMFLYGGRLLDSGISDTIPICQIESATTAVVYWSNINQAVSAVDYVTGRQINATTPWTWGTNDRIQIYWSYEKA